jgi:hypothetical protein
LFSARRNDGAFESFRASDEVSRLGSVIILEFRFDEVLSGISIIVRVLGVKTPESSAVVGRDMLILELRPPFSSISIFASN